MRIEGLAGRFTARAAAAPEAIYARFGWEEITWRALADAAESFAQGFARAGLRRGDRAVVMMHNSPASLAVVFALLKSGVVWVPANPALVGEALAHVIRKVSAGRVICEPGVVDSLRRCDAVSEDRLMVIADPALPPAPAGPAPARLAPAPVPQDLAAIMFTSGTTGPAKGVRVTHMMLELAAKSVGICADARPGDTFYMWEPFYHIGGAQVLLLPLFTDISLSIRSRFSASRFWQDVRQTGATHIHHLGGIIQLLLKQQPGPQDRDHKVRVAWGGGCAPEAWRPFEQRFGVEIRECYGMTEASSLTTCNLEGVVGSIGRPMPWFDVRLKGADGHEVGAGEGPGEIVVTTTLPGAIFDGYYEAPEATARALRPDGFHTGDLGSMDENGMLYFHGRTGDSLRCRGENVSAWEVEGAANRHPAVEDSAMVGVPAKIGENDIHLFVRLRPGSETTATELAAWLDTELAPFQRPRFLTFVADFPRTASQRIQKHLLKDLPPRWERPGRG